jgi:hypothetical protein
MDAQQEVAFVQVVGSLAERVPRPVGHAHTLLAGGLLAADTAGPHRRHQALDQGQHGRLGLPAARRAVHQLAHRLHRRVKRLRLLPRAPARLADPGRARASARTRHQTAHRHGPGPAGRRWREAKQRPEREGAARRARLQPGERRGRERVRGERGAVQLRAAGRHAQPGAKRLQRLLAAAVRCARGRAPASALGQPRTDRAACILHAWAHPAASSAERLQHARSQRHAARAASSSQRGATRTINVTAYFHMRHEMRRHAGPAARERQARVIRARPPRSAAAAVRWGRRFGAARVLREPRAALRRGPPGARASRGAPWCRSRQAARTCSAAGTAPTSSATIARRRSGRTAGR